MATLLVAFSELLRNVHSNCRQWQRPHKLSAKQCGNSMVHRFDLQYSKKCPGSFSI